MYNSCSFCCVDSDEVKRAKMLLYWIVQPWSGLWQPCQAEAPHKRKTKSAEPQTKHKNKHREKRRTATKKLKRIRTFIFKSPLKRTGQSFFSVALFSAAGDVVTWSTSGRSRCLCAAIVIAVLLLIVSFICGLLCALYGSCTVGKSVGGLWMNCAAMCQCQQGKQRSDRECISAARILFRSLLHT